MLIDRGHRAKAGQVGGEGGSLVCGTLSLEDAKIVGVECSESTPKDSGSHAEVRLRCEVI